MIPEQKGHSRDRGSGFVEFLRDIAAREDRGALAALRRSIQEPTGIAMSACPYVVPFLPPEPNRFVERAYFLVAALFALHPDHAQGVSLGHAFRRINDETVEGQKGSDNESTRGRFVALLDAHPDDIADHLRHAVSLARARAVPVDWARMLKDLVNWGAPDRWVQRRLAADFWRSDSDDTHASSPASTSAPESEKTS